MSPTAAPQWTEWLDISTAESGTGPFAKKAGVYQIRAVESKSSNQIPIGRLGSVDHDGLLYIGYSESSIAERVKIFRRDHLPYLLARTRLPEHGLQVRAKLLPPGEAYNEEQKEIARHRNQFGENTPCNRNAER